MQPLSQARDVKLWQDIVKKESQSSLHHQTVVDAIKSKRPEELKNHPIPQFTVPSDGINIATGEIQFVRRERSLLPGDPSTSKDIGISHDFQPIKTKMVDFKEDIVEYQDKIKSMSNTQSNMNENDKNNFIETKDDDNVSVKSLGSIKSKISNLSQLSTMSRSKLIDTKERVRMLLNRDEKYRKMLQLSSSHQNLLKKIENKICELDQEYEEDPDLEEEKQKDQIRVKNKQLLDQNTINKISEQNDQLNQEENQNKDINEGEGGFKLKKFAEVGPLVHNNDKDSNKVMKQRTSKSNSHVSNKVSDYVISLAKEIEIEKAKKDEAIDLIKNFRNAKNLNAIDDFFRTQNIE